MDELKLLKKEVEILTDIKDIGLKTNKREYVLARGIFFETAKKMKKKNPYSLQVLGSYVNKDHCGVINTCKKLPVYLNSYPKFRDAYERLTMNKPTYQIEAMIKKICELERRLREKGKKGIKTSHEPLLELINQVPDYHVETVRARLDPIIKMLEKPSIHNYLPKD